MPRCVPASQKPTGRYRAKKRSGKNAPKVPFQSSFAVPDCGHSRDQLKVLEGSASCDESLEMNIFERSQRGLARRDGNGPKVAALFFVDAAAWLALDAAGVNDLTSPWLILPLVPLALIYVGERLGKILWFEGMTLPIFFVTAGSIAFVWVAHASAPVPDALIYFVLTSWIAAFGFLLVRMWTFAPSMKPIS
jgi:hypothetical protein